MPDQDQFVRLLKRHHSEIMSKLEELEKKVRHIGLVTDEVRARVVRVEQRRWLPVRCPATLRIGVLRKPPD